MAFLVIARDHPGRQPEKAAAREAHRAYLAGFGARLLASGPLVEAGEVTGGLALLDTDDRAAAERFHSDDPYALAGLRASAEVLEWPLRWWLGAFDPGGHRPSA